MWRTKRRGGDICSNYLNSSVGVNCPDRDIAAHLHQYTLTRHPETRRAATDTCLCLEFYPLLWSGARSAVHAKKGNRGIWSGRV